MRASGTSSAILPDRPVPRQRSGDCGVHGGGIRR
jgi:hypothetical protein